MAAEFDAIPLCPVPPTLLDGVPMREAALTYYRTLLDKRGYYDLTDVPDLDSAVQDTIYQALREARIMCMGAELLTELVLQRMRKSEQPEGAAMWPADRTGPMTRATFERSWPGTIPERVKPPFSSTLILIDTPMDMLLGAVEEGGPLLVRGFLVTEDTCAVFAETHDQIYFTAVYVGDNFYLPTPALIVYTALDALLTPEIEITTQHFSRKQKKQLIGKGACVTMGAPAPYYEVRMSTRLGPANPNPEPRVVDWSHRWDVRAHNRTLVRRGMLPLAPKDRLKLTLRGYVIVEGDIPYEIARSLEQRGKPPKRTDEWVAVKTSIVKSHQRGPEDKPYVPSVHVEEWSERMEQ